MAQGIAEVLGETGEQVGSPFDGQPIAGEANYPPFSFTGKRFLLERLLERCVTVIPRTDFNPVLKHVQAELSATDGTGIPAMRFTGTDLELSMITSTPAVIMDLGQLSHVRAVLPARKLLAILGEAPDGDVTISVVKDNATVTAGSASWVLHLGSNGNDFPQVWPGIELWHEAPLRPLLEALRTVRYAVSKTAPELQQVSVEPNTQGVPCVTACDRTRFARVAVPGFPLSMRIPAAGADTLVKLLADSEAEAIRVADTPSRLVFAVGSATMIVAKLGKDFPDVEKLMLAPTIENKHELVADRAEMMDALRRVRINADDTTSALSLHLRDGYLTLASRDKARNTATETIQVTWTYGERQLIVNHKFLSDMLTAHPAAACTFRLGKDIGKRRAALLLEDTATGVTGIINQMSASALVGY